MSISFGGSLNIPDMPMYCRNSGNIGKKFLEKNLNKIGTPVDDENKSVLKDVKFHPQYITKLSRNGIGYEFPLTGGEVFFKFGTKLNQNAFNNLLAGYNAAKSDGPDVQVDLKG